MSLTATAIRNATPTDKTQRLFDGQGLYLEITPKGGKWWRFKYRFALKEKRISLGVYPEVSLAEAREARDEARRHIRAGKDPSAVRKTGKASAVAAAANTFEVVGREWLGKQKGTLAPATYAKAQWLLEELAFPWLGSRPIADIEAPEVLAVLRRVEERGKLETAHRLKQRCSQVFRYAIASGLASRDPCPDLRGAIASPKEQHRAAITDEKELGGLLRALNGYKGTFITACALKFAPLVFVRPGELRHAEWAEINLDLAEWRIPAEKMKMREAHIVPLSTQAVAILRELQPLTGRGRYVFPGERSRTRPMSENTVLAALRRLGYSKEQMTGHGFRSTASTILHEMGWSSAVIERQLAHAERNKVKAAYNHAEYMPERRRMMQVWADHLYRLAKGAEIVPIRRSA